MKKVVIIYSSIIVIGLLISLLLWVLVFENYSKGYNFKVVDGEVILTSYKGDDDIIEIPSEIRGKPVVKLGRGNMMTVYGMSSKGMFDGSTAKKIIIPEGIREIDNSVFRNAEIEEIIIPSTLKVLGNGNFWFAKNLKTVDFKGKIKTIPIYTFSSCDSLEEIELPRSVEKIEHSAFANCDKLKKVVIYENVTEIAEYAFEKSTSVRIYGVAGSYAEEYANKMEIPFEEIENIN